MNTTGNMDGTAAASGGILSRERTIAKAGFNRWLVPPATTFWDKTLGTLTRGRRRIANGRSLISAGCSRFFSLRSAPRPRFGADGSSTQDRARRACTRRSAGVAA
jgi:hypothetical protein